MISQDRLGTRSDRNRKEKNRKEQKRTDKKRKEQKRKKKRKEDLRGWFLALTPALRRHRCNKTVPFFECFPYVCPEPVLVK
jgi:hypothetical protein